MDLAATLTQPVVWVNNSSHVNMFQIVIMEIRVITLCDPRSRCHAKQRALAIGKQLLL